MSQRVEEERKDVQEAREGVHGARQRVAMQRRQLRHASAVLKRREARLHREKKELADAKRAKTGPAKGVDWGLERAADGLVEKPPYSNDSPWMREHFPKFGWHPGWAWCQYMANEILVKGGGPVLPSGYTVAVVQWAREGKYDLQIVSRSNLQVGDFTYFKFPGVSGDFCDHVGTYAGASKILEGNTSPGSGGSQNNGGGLYLRSLAERSPYIVAVVRPSYTT